MSQENFWVLLSKKISGEASDAELKEFENLILAHPEWQYAIQNLEELWKQQPPKDEMQAEDAYLLHLHRVNEMDIPFGDSPVNMPVITERRRIKKWYWIAAAVLVLAFGLFAFGQFLNNRNEKEEPARQVNEISTRKGSKSKVQLPDGSIVWLNAGSKLTYNKEYGQQSREVTLTGEGYFDVITMKEKPFIIHTATINIIVLGTVFNVRTYPEDKQTETSLIRGSIEVTINNRPDSKIILSPNEKLVVENNAGAKIEKGGKEVPPVIAINKLKYNPADSTVAEIQWVENKLVFDDESFGELALKMERWYNVDIEINDQKLLRERMTGNFEKETINQAMEALKEMIPFRYEQTDNKIIIYR